MSAERDQRIVRTRGLVGWVLRRLRATVYVPPDLEEDVHAAGMMGLVRAAQRYQPGRGSWPAYARGYIRGAMLDWITWWNAGWKQLVPLEVALNVPAADAGLEARLTAAEILSAAPEADRTAMEAYMRDEVVADLDSALAGARSRLGIVVRDVEALGRTFPAARFWAHVPDRPEDGCWIWRGTMTRQGYGQFSVDEGGRRWRHYLAHRVAWLLEHRELPRGARVTQTCGERRCVRPDHLRLSTRRLTALAAVLAALLLAGCGPRVPDVDAAYGVYGTMIDGSCEPPHPEWRHWRDERTEEVMVVLCLRTGEVRADVMMREPKRYEKVQLMLRDEGKYRPQRRRGWSPAPVAARVD